MMANYNIKKEGFIFYFLWALVIIPVQTLLDILFYNILENFLKLDMFFFLLEFKKRFENRKKIWKALDDETNELVENEVRSLDKMCFSSQYYFSITIHLAGQVLMVLGLQIIISANYNMFSDNFAFIVCTFWLLICIAIHQITKFLGRIFKVWEIHIPESKKIHNIIFLK
jgi:hypothetical protein